MFMWPWASLTSECTSALGPEGIDWILVSPPQEDIQGKQWWTHYQPVSYKLDSQLGTADQFATMVAACNKAGVQVIVDAVINHMANASGTGFAGTNFTKYSYPGLYTPTDFHSGLDPANPHYCTDSINNYNDAIQIVNCELGGLPDLATEKASVRRSIADYLNHLIDLGVAGFRIDAAKHIGTADLTAILGLLHPVNSHPPYLLSESIGSASDNEPYTALGDVFAWNFQDGLTQVFSGIRTMAALPASEQQIGPAASTVIMVSNHDTEHHGPSAITYRDPKTYLAANAYLLATPAGKPMLYTGYAFSAFDTDAGPATSNGDTVAPASCTAATAGAKPQAKYPVGSFICMQRWSSIQGMIQWHHEVADAPRTNLVNSHNLVAFSRGTGFFALNGNLVTSGQSIKTTVKTGLPKGSYCDVISGGAAAASGGKCSGTKVVVQANGTAKISLPAMTALALDAANKLR
jgi:alpha-amylase